jgi:hypothetical protein
MTTDSFCNWQEERGRLSPGKHTTGCLMRHVPLLLFPKFIFGNNPSKLKGRKDYPPCFAVAAACGGEQNGLNQMYYFRI